MVVFTNLNFNGDTISSNVKYVGAEIVEGYASYNVSSGVLNFDRGVEDYILFGIKSAFRQVNQQHKRGRVKNGGIISIAWG